MSKIFNIVLKNSPFNSLHFVLENIFETTVIKIDIQTDLIHTLNLSVFSGLLDKRAHSIQLHGISSA